MDKLRVTGFKGNPLRLVLNNGTEALITENIASALASPHGWRPISEVQQWVDDLKPILQALQFDVMARIDLTTFREFDDCGKVETFRVSAKPLNDLVLHLRKAPEGIDAGWAAAPDKGEK